jgi:glycosyltransferase involved in cell wall biosynthesis
MNPNEWEMGIGADIHVVHSHLPDKLAFDKKTKIVAFQHGSPEHVFEVSITQGVYCGYGAGDSFSIGAYFLRRADAVVTFWGRHAAIWETMTEKPVFVIPMGVSRSFWDHIETSPLAGSPSILTAENCHTVKWPLDLFFMWPNIVKELPDARLHALNIPYDQHKWWMPLAYLNGTHYTSYLYATKLNAPELRQFMSAAGFYYSPCRYGDHNRISLEAAACGAKVISFCGNEYAHYWVREGDQRCQKEDLENILSGKTPAREPLPVPDIKSTAAAMLQIYKDIA